MVKCGPEKENTCIVDMATIAIMLKSSHKVNGLDQTLPYNFDSDPGHKLKTTPHLGRVDASKLGTIVGTTKPDCSQVKHHHVSSCRTHIYFEQDISESIMEISCDNHGQKMVTSDTGA